MNNTEAEQVENFDNVEKEFTILAVEHACEYWKSLEDIKNKKIKFTDFDDDIYQEFIIMFPEYNMVQNLKVIDENEIKNEQNKIKWRSFSEKFKHVNDYNFGTLLRINTTDEYTEKNTILVLRIQFLAFEISRNKHDLNSWISEDNKHNEN